MGFIGGPIGYWLLKKIAPPENFIKASNGGTETDSEPVQPLKESFVRQIQDKVVIDFGCGHGRQTVEMAARGAARAIGLDIQERHLARGRALAVERGVADRCDFTTRTQEQADIILCINAFEHFSDPAGVLRTMATLLKPDGRVFISFGPCWYHPLGGHLFSVFPWSHLIFTEQALIRWRSEFKTDGATCFAETAGGLNQMTIGRYRQYVEQSPFCFEQFDTIPIRPFKLVHHPLTHEFTTSVVRSQLRLR